MSGALGHGLNGLGLGSALILRALARFGGDQKIDIEEFI